MDILQKVAEIRARMMIAIAGSETTAEIDRILAPFYAEISALVDHKPVAVTRDPWRCRTYGSDF